MRGVYMIERCEECNSPLVVSNSGNKFAFECSYCGVPAGEGQIISFDEDEDE